MHFVDLSTLAFLHRLASCIRSLFKSSADTLELI